MNKNIQLMCPLCKSPLHHAVKSLRCVQNHTFDLAKQGYVNLLPVQQKKSLHPGDTREMLLARRAFLNAGTYLPLCEQVLKTAQRLSLPKEKLTIADIGCGEGYYLQALATAFPHGNCIGIDIAKDGVKLACTRGKDISWVVATASALPLAGASVDMITAMFSLVMEDEFFRVLKPGGCVIEVTAAKDHLKELKEVIYEEVFAQDKRPSPISAQFKVLSCNQYQFCFTAEKENLQNLLKMTPHFWRIKRERREELAHMEKLPLTVAYWVRVLQKQ